MAATAHSRFRLALEEGLRVVKEWKDPQPEAEEPHWGIVFNKVTHGALEKNGCVTYPVGGALVLKCIILFMCESRCSDPCR